MSCSLIGGYELLEEGAAFDCRV